MLFHNIACYTHSMTMLRALSPTEASTASPLHLDVIVFNDCLPPFLGLFRPKNWLKGPTKPRRRRSGRSCPFSR